MKHKKKRLSVLSVSCPYNFIFNAKLVDINLFSTTFLFAMKRTGHIVREKYLNTQQDYLPSLTFHKDVKLFTAGT